MCVHTWAEMGEVDVDVGEMGVEFKQKRGLTGRIELCTVQGANCASYRSEVGIKFGWERTNRESVGVKRPFYLGGNGRLSGIKATWSLNLRRNWAKWAKIWG